MGHHEELGVRPGATPDEIKRAWRREAKRHHPDLARDEADRLTRTARTARINAAKDALLALAAAYQPPPPAGSRRYAPTGRTHEPATRFWRDPAAERGLVRRLIYIWTRKSPS